MNDQLPQFDELRQLLIGLIDEEADRDFAAKRHRLMELLRDDPQARRFYLEYIMTDAMLRLELSAPLAGAGMESEFDLAARRHFGNQEVDAAVLLGEPALDAPPAPPRIIIDPTATGRYRDAGSPFVGGFVFSYMVASIFMCLLLLGFWAYKLPSDRGSSIASSDNSRRSTTSGEASPHDRPAPVFVGRITGIAGAKWSDEPNYIAPLGVRVALGRTYKLKSGLMEITYDSGAKVILEGPCSYEVDSTAGGYLALGKLVARVGAGGKGRGMGGVVSGQLSVTSVKEEGGRRKEEGDRPNADSLATSHQPLATNSQSPSPLSPLPSPLFTVRTPTAIVTDLGTEFGVEVDEAGDCWTHVFQGQVELKPTITTDNHSPILLGENDSARISLRDHTVQVSFAQQPERDFVRRVPMRTRVCLHNTGIGLRIGDSDPHWQIIAVGGDPDFKPRQAVASATPPYDRWLWNHPRRVQWISLSTTENGPTDLAAGTYTYRTTFQLRGVDLAAFKIKGAFLADNHVDAIRINGRSLRVPEHGYDIPIDEPVEFVISEGFAEGENVLEFDVLNGNGSNPNPESPSPTGLRVEFMGVTRASPSAPHTDIQPSKGGQKMKEP